jgi:hypothetical protein
MLPCLGNTPPSNNQIRLYMPQFPVYAQVDLALAVKEDENGVAVQKLYGF